MRRIIEKLLLLIFVTLSIRGGASTALQDYVDQKDDSFDWRITAQRSNQQGTEYTVRMTSQRWLTGQEVDQPLWQHWMAVYVPLTVEHTTAFLMISGGGNSDTPPQNGSSFLAQMAVKTRSVTALLLNVPSQPLLFTGDKAMLPRSEDDILAWCWAQYLKNQDPQWLTLLPMTKSAVRAMDTVSALCKTLPGSAAAVDRFVLSGQSKRGWTTWLTAAADRRVVAIAPQVIDLLNMVPSMEHHRSAYGGYSAAVAPYVRYGIMDAMHTPESEASRAIIDPWSYRRALTLPKLILNSTGDQFFLPDSSRFYYSELPEPKYLRYVPNTSHGLDRSVNDTLLSFYSALLKNTPLPSFTWTTPEPGRLCVTVRQPPTEVRVWQAVNPLARDFREETIGKVWQSTVIQPVDPTANPLRYEVNLPAPPQGWRAFFVECIFPDPARERISLTTEVSVIPVNLPF